jgi:hypothetical protein
MDTPRPIIVVENLGIDKRPWPKAVNVGYEKGCRYSFRIGKLEYRLWKWPWPEWIGLPSKETLEEWLDLIYDWRNTNVGRYDIGYMDKCMNGVIKYL